MIVETIKQALAESLAKFGVSNVELKLEHPADEAFGDWSSNAALQYVGQTEQFNNPRDFAQAIVEELKETLANNSEIAKIEIAGPGFINFTLSHKYLLNQLKNPSNIEKQQFGKLIFEYMQPNTNKPLHVGHLRNSVLGVAMINLLKEVGWDVRAATINNDRGLHIIKSMWGYLLLGKQTTGSAQEDWKTVIQSWNDNPQLWIIPDQMTEKRLQKPDHFLGHWYVEADKFVEDEKVQKQWQSMLIAWEEDEDKFHQLVKKLWQRCNDWFYEGYQVSARRIGVFFDEDQISYESAIYKAGKEIILNGLREGIFQKAENGAVIADLEKYGLPPKVLLRSDGTAIYMTFDIELTKQRSEQKTEKFVWEVGSDQDLYFKQLFAIAEMLGFGSKQQFKHFSYGMVRLPEGKMSSRKGTVIYADDVIDQAEIKAKKIMTEAQIAKDFSDSEKEAVADAVGMGALKWSLLSVDPVSDVAFDLDKSVSFSGNSGPYLQYTFARTQSILANADEADDGPVSVELNSEELAILKHLMKFDEAIEKSAKEYAPHVLCLYLYELAQKFNAFYSQHSVLNAEHEKNFRILLTRRTSETLQKGLALLGIASLSKM